MELQAELEAYGACDPVNSLLKWKESVGPWCSRGKLRHVARVKDNATHLPSARHVRTMELMKMADNYSITQI
jgi:hypothetical protein